MRRQCRTPFSSVIISNVKYIAICAFHVSDFLWPSQGNWKSDHSSWNLTRLHFVCKGYLSLRIGLVSLRISLRSRIFFWWKENPRYNLLTRKKWICLIELTTPGRDYHHSANDEAAMNMHPISYRAAAWVPKRESSNFSRKHATEGRGNRACEWQNKDWLCPTSKGSQLNEPNCLQQSFPTGNPHTARKWTKLLAEALQKRDFGNPTTSRFHYMTFIQSAVKNRLFD